ncbi:hypothetical protein [Halarchaeum salinum]|uniref:hypothetical protein n=1 Tax=Halarchaeum salinum TaxID=489912 RepID=UPI0031CE59C5
MEEGQLGDISPPAWRLLRVAAGYTQREVEREIDDFVQAHISMLEGGNRSLSAPRRRMLFNLYAEELTEVQAQVLIEHF